jgi:SAM-dependent methyltransferase
MTMRVLKSDREIIDARREMIDRKISGMDASTSGKVKAFLSRRGVGNAIVVGDIVKSWDILSTVNFLKEHLSKRDPILDIGCYASEILVVLHKSGFTDLAGVDLNPLVRKMPAPDKIRYVTSDFMGTPFADKTFAAITAISVIEHGFDGPRLLGEMARLLRPGGLFIASFDYWPDKIDTNGTKIFGMEWLIFSREEVCALVGEAAKHGLYPIGDLLFDGQEQVIVHGGYRYTFGWLALQKRG